MLISVGLSALPILTSVVLSHRAQVDDNEALPLSADNNWLLQESPVMPLNPAWSFSGLGSVQEPIVSEEYVIPSLAFDMGDLHDAFPTLESDHIHGLLKAQHSGSSYIAPNSEIIHLEATALQQTTYPPASEHFTLMAILYRLLINLRRSSTLW